MPEVTGKQATSKQWRGKTPSPPRREMCDVPKGKRLATWNGRVLKLADRAEMELPVRRLAAERRSRSRVCGDRAIAASACFAQGFDGLSGGEKRRGLDVSHGTASGESDGDGRGGDVVWKFSDGQDVEGAESEERGMDFAAKLFDGRAHRFQAVLGILHQARPSFLGVADLMAEVGHAGGSFLERGQSRGIGGTMRPQRWGVKRKG